LIALSRKSDTIFSRLGFRHYINHVNGFAQRKHHPSVLKSCGDIQAAFSDVIRWRLDCGHPLGGDSSGSGGRNLRIDTTASSPIQAMLPSICQKRRTDERWQRFFQSRQTPVRLSRQRRLLLTQGRWCLLVQAEKTSRYHHKDR